MTPPSGHCVRGFSPVTYTSHQEKSLPILGNNELRFSHCLVLLQSQQQGGLDIFAFLSPTLWDWWTPINRGRWSI
eukprot:1064302-Ditylum_brightwellii.AAC.1